MIATAAFERWRTPALLLTAAFVVKLSVRFQLHDHPLLLPHGELDTAYYVELGQRIASGDIFAVTGPFFVSPLYVYFLATIFALGGSLMTAKVIQIGLGAAAIGLLFATARHWFGARAAVVAAILAILTGLFTFYEVLILPAALDPFLVSYALYLLTRTRAIASLWVFAAAGTTLGLFALNRPNALAYAAVAGVLVAWDAWWRRDVRGSESGSHRSWQRPREAVVLGTCLLLVIATNALRNYAFYVQDSWKPSPRLTANVGMRFDYTKRVDLVRNITRQKSWTVLYMPRGNNDGNSLPDTGNSLSYCPT